MCDTERTDSIAGRFQDTAIIILLNKLSYYIMVGSSSLQAYLDICSFVYEHIKVFSRRSKAAADIDNDDMILNQKTTKKEV